MSFSRTVVLLLCLASCAVLTQQHALASSYAVSAGDDGPMPTSLSVSGHTCDALSPPYVGYTQQGTDLVQYPMASLDDSRCAQACCAQRTPLCLGYTIALNNGSSSSCTLNQPCCFLKQYLGPLIPSSNATSGALGSPSFQSFPGYESSAPVIRSQSVETLDPGFGASLCRATLSCKGFTLFIVNNSDSGANDCTPGQPCCTLTSASQPLLPSSSLGIVSGAFACPAGYRQLDQLTAACEICPVGTFSSELSPAMSCSPCPAGSFSGAPGAATCALCPAGSSSEPGASSCTACPAGSYAPTPGGPCYGTPPGTWQNSTGAASVRLCADGTLSPANATSASQCASCPPGTSGGGYTGLCCPGGPSPKALAALALCHHLVLAATAGACVLGAVAAPGSTAGAGCTEDAGLSLASTVGSLVDESIALAASIDCSY